MAKPSILCKLTKGKAIGAFSGFVDTFNYIVDFIENLKGDGDSDDAKSITVDRSTPDRPVIKLKGGSGTLEVITDFSCAIEDGFLQIKLTKAKMSGVSYESIEYDPDIHRRPIAGAITGKSVITNTHYNNDGDHIFKQNKIDGALILYPNESGTPNESETPAEETQSVFETTLHS